ncbi:MAG: KEOPS complex subunit Cgi121 [Nitrososphaerota archaeon]
MRTVRFGDVVAAVSIVETDGVGDVDEVLTRLRDLAEGCEVQLFNPDLLVDWEHFDAVLTSAILSFKSGGSAKSLGLEFLTRLAATRQVSEAIAVAGVESWFKQVGILVLGGEYGRVAGAAQKILVAVGGTEVELAYTAERVQNVAMRYGVGWGPMTHIQAMDRLEAVKLAIIQRVATSII